MLVESMKTWIVSLFVVVAVVGAIPAAADLPYFEEGERRGCFAVE